VSIGGSVLRHETVGIRRTLQGDEGEFALKRCPIFSVVRALTGTPAFTYARVYA